MLTAVCVTMTNIYGVASLVGIGFTMSIFIAGLAFDTPAELDIAKVGIMLGSIASGALGVVVLMNVCGKGGGHDHLSTRLKNPEIRRRVSR